MLSEFAPAKINLTLHVTGRRADGYHLLNSIVVFADVGDHLQGERAGGMRLTSEGPFSGAMPEMQDNLVMRAARALQAHADIAQGAALMLAKHLPSGAGLGGGSADAAATLRLLNQLWQLRLSERELQDVALTLGADVPVCVGSSPQRMQGIGERLSTISLADDMPCYVVLGWPGVGLSTPQVFARYSENRQAAGMGYDDLLPDIAGLISLAMVREGHNALEDAAMALCSPLAQMHAVMREKKGGALTRMSGSGSACFTLFERRAQAEAACAALQASLPECWFAAGQILT